MKGQNFTLQGAAGDIECHIQYPEKVTHGWVVLHPHPLYGGKMNNPVLYHLRGEMHARGGLTLSFNFRGVGLSAGTYSGGWGEREDTGRVIHHFHREWPDLPLHLFGYSFGALVALETAREEVVESLALVGFPLTNYFRYPDRTRAKRVILFQGEKDEFGTPQQVSGVFEQTRIQAEVIPIPASNHFFENHLQDLVDGFARAVYG